MCIYAFVWMWNGHAQLENECLYLGLTIEDDGKTAHPHMGLSFHSPNHSCSLVTARGRI